MKNWLRGLALLGVLMLAVPATYAQDDEIVASLQNVSGQVQVVKKDRTEPVPAKNGELLNSGDTVVTSVQARATIKFRDGSEIRLFQNTRFVLQAAKESAGNDRSFKYDLKLRAGALWGLFAKQRQLAQISTPTATIGIKGTTLRVSEVDNKARVALTEGLIEVSNERKTVELEPGKRLVDFTRQDDLSKKIESIPYKLEMRSDKRKLGFENNQPEEVFVTLQLVNVSNGREVPRAATIYFRSNYDKVTFPQVARLDQRGFARLPLTLAPPEAADAQLSGNVYVWAVIDQEDADDTGEGRILFTIPVPQGEERIRVDAQKGEGRRAR